MRITFLIVFTLTVILCVAQPRVFKEEEFVLAVKKNHPVARQAYIGVKIAEAEVLTSRGAFDPVFSVDNSGKELDGTRYYTQRKTEIKIPTWYGIDIYAGKENITGSRVNLEETKGSLNYIGFSAPLLQSFLMDKRRAALKQAKIFLDLSEVQQNIVINDLLLEATSSYWDWWETYHIYQLMQSSLKNAEKRLTMVRTAYSLGDRPAIDTLEAAAQVMSFSIKQNETFSELVKAALQLSTFLWTDNQQNYDLPADIVPQDWVTSESINKDDLLKAAATNPEIIKYRFKLDAQEIENRLKLQLVIPQLNLKYNQIGYNFTKIVNDSWFNDNYRLGISVNMPLRLSEGRGEYRKARLKISQISLEQADKQVQTFAKVGAYYNDLQQTMIQISMQGGLVKNMTALQSGEEIRFFNGESTLFLINARESRTIESLQKLIELKAKNRKALLNLKWVAGIINN
ncbi:MAG: TolC family protein [Chitinophagaceae bacterium]